MEVYIEQEDRTVKTKAPTVKALLAKLKINPVTVIVVRDKDIVTEEARLKPKDKIRILSVISGG